MLTNQRWKWDRIINNTLVLNGKSAWDVSMNVDKNICKQQGRNEGFGYWH